MAEQSDIYLMIGNPGVGKSTILNGLLREARFKSGMCAGTGMTFELDKYTTQTGVTYADTPGLADTEKRQQAAKVITEALKLGGSFRIFFVVTLQQGRVKPEDVTTMKLVLEAAPITSYGIIVNQLSPKEYANLNVENAPEDSTTPSYKEKVFVSLLAGLPADKKTLNICSMKRDDELDGEDNMAKPLPLDVQQFILSLPPVVIEPRDVQWVRADAFEKEREALSKQLEETQKSNQRLEQALNVNKKEMARIQGNVAQQRENIKQLKDQLAEERSEWERTKNNLNDQLTAAQGGLDTLRNKVKELEDGRKDWEKEKRDEFKEQLRSAEEKASKKAGEITADLDKLRKDIKERDARITTLEKKADEEKEAQKKWNKGVTWGGVGVGVVGIIGTVMTGGLAAPVLAGTATATASTFVPVAAAVTSAGGFATAATSHASSS